MSKLIITRGVPGSGKTTWAIEWLNQDLTKRSRVNRDEIRFTNFGAYHGVDEHHVSKLQDAAVHSLMILGRDIVVDNTHLKARNVKSLMMIAVQHEYEVEFEDFPVTLEQAVQRDDARSWDGERFVGAKVVKSFFDRYITNGTDLPPVPTLEGSEVKFAPYTHTEGLPNAILVDIDGTLAHMKGRSPYDPTLYHTDTVDTAVRGILDTYWAAGFHIIVFTARDGNHRTETLDWLGNHDVWYNELHMRDAGDKRNDAIVKDEMFEKHIAGKFNVEFILDDRDRVVNMYREKGLKVLQVAPGAF